jgi:nucleoside-diphosphate-sugar epimerase
MPKPTIVTGANGDLGRAIMQYFTNLQLPVFGIDLEPGPWVQQILDIRDQPAVEALIKDAQNVVHTAALHARHLDLGFDRSAFIETNIQGTLNLLESAERHGLSKFVYTSSTSIYGDAMIDDQQAVWVDEQLSEQPRDIYDITKQAAEQLCKDFFSAAGLQTCVLRVSRFLPEPQRILANHRLYRGLDLRDAAQAHKLALETNFDKFQNFVISSQSPFNQADLSQLKTDAPAVICRYYPQALTFYKSKGWSLPSSIDRVYVVDKARKKLGYEPAYNFDCLISDQN